MARDIDQNLIWSVQGFEGGLNTEFPAHALDGTESPDAENFDASVSFALKKRFGTSNFSGTHSSSSGTVIRGMGAFTPASGTTRFLVKEGTKVYDIQAGNWTSEVTGATLSDGDQVHFAFYQDTIVMVSEETTPIAPLKATTGNFTALGGSPPSAKYVCLHKGRMFLACTAADESRVYYSAINNVEDWSTTANAGNFYVSQGDGQSINGIMSDGEVLYISKKSKGTSDPDGSMWAVYGSGPSDFQPARQIAPFGAVSQRAMGLLESYAVFASVRGVFAVQGNKISWLSQPVNKTITDLSYANAIQMVVGRYKDQLWVAYVSSGSVNNAALVLDITSGRWSRYKTIAAREFAEHPDGNLYWGYSTTGANTPKVLKYDVSVVADEGSAITMYWHTPDLEWGQWFVDKRWQRAVFHVLGTQAVTWTLTHTIDGTASADNATFVGNVDGPVYLMEGYGPNTEGRFFRFKLAEASSTLQGELYGMMFEAEARPRSR